jgi:hypothetical protein
MLQMDDSLQHPNDLPLLGGREIETSGDASVRHNDSQALKKHRVAKEFSQCLDAILDQSEFMYNASNPGSQSNYESTFTVPTAAAAVPVSLIHKPSKPAYMMNQLQSISSANAMMLPAPEQAENIIPLPTLPTISTISTPVPTYAPLPVPVSFRIAPIVTTSSPDVDNL